MTRTTVAALVAAAGLLAGCGGHKVDKTGKLIHEKPVVLALADHENSTLGLENWIRAVERRSSGTIRVDFRGGWRADDPNFDRDTIADVRAGRVQIAKISARAWDEVGVPSFRALVAPLLIDSYALERRVLQSDVPARMLAGAAKVDLVGLAVLPGLLRKPLGISRVLRGPRDYVGARIGIRPGGVTRQTITALHAKPVVYPPGDRAAVARLDGAELDADVIDGNAYDRGSRGLTANVALWPRAETLVINRREFAKLSAAQKRALTGAGPPAAALTVQALEAIDASAVHAMCRRGLRLVTASDADLRALRRAMEPVYAALERDAQTRMAIAEIQSMKRNLSAPTVSHCGSTSATAPSASSALDGTYHSTITRTQLLGNPKYEQGEDNPSNYGHFTLTIRHGRWRLAGSAAHDVSSGTLAIHGARVVLRPTYPADIVGETWVYQWSRYRGVVSFTKVSPGPTSLVVHPWRP